MLHGTLNREPKGRRKSATGVGYVGVSRVVDPRSPTSRVQSPQPAYARVRYSTPQQIGTRRPPPRGEARSLYHIYAHDNQRDLTYTKDKRLSRVEQSSTPETPVNTTQYKPV